jgi:tetratricopeptide (TPR) repeat protein
VTAVKQNHSTQRHRDTEKPQGRLSLWKFLCFCVSVSYVLLLIATPANAQQAKRDRFKEAETAADAKKFDEAIALYGEIGDDKKVKLEDRTRALTKQFELLRNQKRYDDAIASIRKQLALPSDVQRQKQLNFWIAEVQVAAKQLDAGIATLRELAGKYPDDPDTVVSAQLTIAGHLGREKQFVPAAEAYEAAFKAMDADDPRAADLLWNTSTQSFVGEQYEKSIAAAEKLLDARYRTWPRGQNGEVIDRIAAAYGKLKRSADAVALYRKHETLDPNPLFRSRWCLRAAQTAQQAGDLPAARDAYRRLMIDHAADGSTEGWWDAQVHYIDGLIDAGNAAEALKHTRILMDVASDVNQLTFAYQKMGGLLEKIDGNRNRMKDLVNGTLFGPAGRDGKPGTADDNKDVLSTIEYPADAERNAAFAKAFATLGDDAAATYHRAHLCLYSGHPKQAYALLADATRRAGHADWTNYAASLVMNGLRVARGPGGLDDAARFLLSGEGENPFTDIPAVASTPWPVPALSADDKQKITAVSEGLLDLATNPSLGGDARAQAIRGYARAIEALGTTPSAEPFYPLINEPEPAPVRDQATAMVLRLERGGELHVSKVKAFLATDALPAQAQKRAEAEFQRATKPLARLTLKNQAAPRLQAVK